VVKKLAYVLICIPVFIIQGHDIFEHHHDFHHSEQGTTHQEKGHNAFSLVDLDEDFTLQSRVELSNLVTVLSSNAIEIAVPAPAIVKFFLPGNKYPPPEPDVSLKFLRAPPFNSFCY